jgi:hypothetical protein
MMSKSRVHFLDRHLALQVGGGLRVRVPPYIKFPPTAPGSTMDTAVPHLPLMTAHLLFQVLACLLLASDQDHPKLIGDIAVP